MGTLRAPKLDARLSAAMRLAEPCAVCADIGADHGRLSAALLWSGAAEHVLAADISASALEKARRRLHALRLDSRVTYAVADGLDALDAMPGRRADTVLILGMGGDTVAGILRRGRDRLDGAALVLGAQTSLPSLRRTLCEVGYRLGREELVLDGGRWYVLMKAFPARGSEPPYTEEEELLGPILLRERPPLWPPFLNRRKELLESGIRAMERAALAKDARRLAQFRRELDYVNGALARGEGDARS